MGIKTRKAGAVSAAAMILAVAASADSTGAFARAASASPTTVAELPALSEPVPTFVSEPVVQDVPEIPEEPEAAVEPVEAEVSASSLRDLVRKVRVKDSLNEQMKCLATAVYFEARGEPLAGQLAVAKVIMNRAESRQFPSSYCGVVKQRSQFSFVRGGRLPAPKKGTTAWKRAKAIAKIASNDLWDSEAKDSLYFHANYVKPSWARKKSKRARISTHIFYR